jgi:hypothetical protein
MIFSKSFSGFQKVFHERYEITTTIRHRGERGRQREQGLATFLRETLPEAYGVATGEIIPFRGELSSPQCDIIVYDKLFFPVLGRRAAVQQIPLEAVYAVIECKSVINGQAIRDAGMAFRQIRSLPRCKSRTRLKPHMRRGPTFFLFGYRLGTTTARCLDFVSDRIAAEDTAVAALDSGLTIFLEKKNGVVKPIWLPATDNSSGVYDTLTFFFVALLERIRATDLGQPRMLDLLGSFE